MLTLRSVGALLSLLITATAAASAPISVIDDAGRSITLEQPAQRIISLAPHATELLFAAGASKRIIGVSAHSDFPPAANMIPSVGGISGIDIERIAKLKPDLIVAWGDGNKHTQMQRLRHLNIPIFVSNPHDFEDVATSIERLGKLSGTKPQARAYATDFRHRWKQLALAYQDARVVPVFYQLWKNPLMTLNDTHMVSKVLKLCGGENIFGDLTPLVPTISTEAVLAANPEVIMTPSDADESALTSWQRYSQLRAVKNKNLYTIPADAISRPGPRIIDAAENVCATLDLARNQ
jgi:iron complex transport system substrate-binding protein